MNKFFILAILLAGAITLFYVNYELIENARESWARKKEIVHIQAARTFKTRLERYASVVSGLRSHMINSDHILNGVEMQDFLNHQVKDLNFKDSVIISYLDVDHNFIYSISNNEIDPSSLVGTNVGDYRGETALRNLERVFQDEKLHLYKPLNLIEGWVGISFNFSVRDKGEVIGYVIAIVNFNSIIKDIYDPQFIDEFCHHFTTSNGLDFDRDRVYDNSKIYHDRVDPEYYKNFNIPESNFLYSEIALYEKKFRIGTSYKEPFSWDLMTPLFSGVGYLFFVAMFIYIYRQSQMMNRLNQKLIIINEEVESQKNKIESKNMELEEANASKDKFFSIIGHDIKSPLRSIQTLISLRRDQVISPEETEAFLKDLDQLNSKTVSLLDNLLEWATISQDKGKVGFRQLSINSIAEDIIELNKGASKLKMIEVINILDDNLEIMGDPNMVSGILRNVFSNAIKFTNKNGTIKISGKDQGDRIQISISDNGVGMGVEELQNIFKIVKDAPSKGTDGELGTGLGLVISKEYIELHNGKIWAESEESRGTTFYMTFPKKPA
jgi:signal transduction histidine kinase